VTMRLRVRSLPLLSGLTIRRCQVWQSPGHAIALEGGSIHITCSSRGPLLGIYLKRVLPKASNVIYYEEGREATVDERFRGRVTFSGLQHNLTISVHRLQLPDTGAYACQAIMDSEVWGPGTLVVVTDKLPQAANSCRETQWTHMALSAALAAVCFLAGLGLGAVCARRGTQIRRLCCAGGESSVCVIYEDMSLSRSNTVSLPSQFQ
uniref:Ig-like domain-containing protein n=1 Tax=Sus scrofa TaxID=9823 RepID=A0A8D1RQD3_PIG